MDNKKKAGPMVVLLYIGQAGLIVALAGSFVTLAYMLVLPFVPTG